MGIHKTLTLCFAIAFFAGSLTAEETTDPVASVITSESEATAVLGGGWPPQKFGRKVGDPTMKKILHGAKDKALKISDGADAAEKQNSPEKKIDPKLLAESTNPPKGKAPEMLAEVKAPDSKSPKVTMPAAKKEAEKKKPSPLNIGNGPSPLVLPPLPEVKDTVVTPAIALHTPRPPRPEQKRIKSLYTLGPGDTVSFSAFDRADLERTVRIAPDGTVSYMQAVAVNANGLTVDELRDRMEEELQKYRRDFKLIVSPQQMLSKEFAILGRVRTPGTFPLERPTTVLEGIALAEGVEIGTIRGSAFGLADFERSFVSRNGRKLDVDLCSLYHEGDLSQNQYLQPNDYVYIASILKSEFYVLGAVNSPGKIKMPNKLTVAKAISQAGGFQNEAYKMKVLVIRGDIHHPDVHVVNLRDVLRGNALDIPVESKDIIFVARRPFEILERVLDSAITTYMQTVTTEAINLGYSR
ncbi:MAG: SLBB domain-containing protein [Verrucomicrobiales bacterium]|nr:SLBB domain-containing protein [Verrucomicrobiales bacterium]